MIPLNDRPSTATVLVGVDLGLPHFDGTLEELGLLAQTAGLDPVARITCKRKAPDAALFVGSGKADEIKALAEQTGATEILFDQALSPAQRTRLSGNRDVAFKTRFPAPLGLVLNEWVLSPLHWLQKLNARNPRSLVIYAEFEGGTA